MEEKSVLVIDTPKNCSKCTLHAFYQECSSCTPEVWCPAGNDIEDKYLIGEKRPDWCPLKPLPEKELVLEYEYDPYLRGYDRGWNSAIERITGGR